MNSLLCSTAALILSERLLDCNWDNLANAGGFYLWEKNVLSENMSKSRLYELMRKCDMLYEDKFSNF